MDFTVLLADVVGGSRVPEGLGRLRTETESGGGLVVKVAEGGMTALFATPEAAARAAARMHAALSARGLAAQIAFHSGPIIQQGDDVLGDTVTLAQGLLLKAGTGETIASRHSAEQLSGELLKAVSAREPDVAPRARPDARPAASLALLQYGERVLECSRVSVRAVIGRQRGCTLVIEDPMASRRHCTVEWCQGEVVLQDHSSNGTYVAIRGETEVLLRGDRMPLRGEGAIGFSQARFAFSEAVRFFCG